MLPRKTSKASPNVIFSQGSAAGATHYGSPESPTISHSGQDRHHVSHSATPESSSGSQTKDTSRQCSSVSSRSVALQSCLASRLAQQLANTGSMIYLMSWKNKATPAGRLYCQRQASAHRTRETACSLVLTNWPTPISNDGRGSDYSTSRGAKILKLGGVAKLSAWPTPMCHDAAGARAPRLKRDANRNPNKLESYRHDLADAPYLIFSIAPQWVGWPTPTTSDYKGSGPTTIRKDGKDRTFDRLDYATEQGLSAPIRITNSGAILIGSDAVTENTGQLNPAHSRWLMGFPPEWCACAATVTP